MAMIAKIGAAIVGAVGVASLALADDAACTYEGVKYSDGSSTCQSGTEFRCDDGSWESLDTPCPGKGPAGRSCEFKGTTFSSGAASCQAGTQYKCDAGSWRSLGVACPERAGDAPLGLRTCRLEGSTVSHSSTVCKSGVMYTCDDGEWRNLGTPCR
jgi:hypothetical protein